MSFSPWQPYDIRPKRDFKRLLLVPLLLLAVVLGLTLLPFSWGNNPPKKQAAVSPSPSPVVQLAAPTQTDLPRGQGLSGPQQPTQQEETPTHLPTATILSAAFLSLQKLDAAVVPARDPYSLTQRLRLKSDQPIPNTTGKSPGDYKMGHKDTFNISDAETKRYYSVTATVKQVTEHAYWYVQDGIAVDNPALARVTKAFENGIYPTDHALFGSEWTPGVDNDPRITVLLAPLHGAGGFYSAVDEYTREVNQFSNQREIIFISTGSGWGGLESTLAHEFQHMIHWHEHPDQDIWLNEGASVLASALNGYDIQSVDVDFMRSPNVQLNAWQPNPDAARPNYGASFLFLDYLQQHYGGEKILRAVISAPQPGVTAVDTALANLGYSEGFLDVFKKWTLANLVDGESGAPLDLNYAKRDVQVSPQVMLDSYPTGHSGEVAQFGAEYVQLAPPTDGKPLHVDFSAQAETHIVPAPAHSGSAIWWSNRGDLADSAMTRQFDLTGLQSATLDCYVWFDIEQDYDYAYVEASSDGGATWDALKGQYTTAANPNGNSYGNAYTGKSLDKQGADADGWLHERIDLSQYAGKQVLLRFGYITDDGYNAQGLAVDDISIPELGYKDDAESDLGWQGEGFVRVDNTLPQRYYLAVVKFGVNKVDIQPVEVGSSGEASFDIEGLGVEGGYSKAVLVIAGLTDHNIQKAKYQLSVRPAK